MQREHASKGIDCISLDEHLVPQEATAPEGLVEQFLLRGGGVEANLERFLDFHTQTPTLICMIRA